MRKIQKKLSKKYVTLGSLTVILIIHILFNTNLNNSTVEYKCEDEILQINESDTIPPRTRLKKGWLVYAPNFVNESTLFKLIAKDNSGGSGVAHTYYKIDNSNWNTYTSPFTLVRYSDGEHLIKFCSIDNAGNKGRIRSKLINKDSTSPSTSIQYTPIQAPNIVNNQTSFSLDADDGSGSGIAETYYRIDGSSWNTYTSPFTLEGYSDGEIIIEYLSIDNVRNKNTIKSELINKRPDFTSPTVSISTPSQGTTVNGTILINAIVSDNVGVTKVEFYIDDILQISDSSSPYYYVWDTTFYKNGTHEIKVIAFDANGNTNTDTLKVIVDNSTPTSISSNNLTFAVIILLAIGAFVTTSVAGSIKTASNNRNNPKYKSKYKKAQNRYPQMTYNQPPYEEPRYQLDYYDEDINRSTSQISSRIDKYLEY